ncbi:MAG: hypothetical protein PHD97_00800 [Bacteroidales bacterium]|nr:hypothetical protein [Bacteroidales bacterium]
MQRRNFSKYKFLNKLISFSLRKYLPPNKEEKNLIEEFRKDLLEIKGNQETLDFWDNYSKIFTKLVINSDPRNFLNWLVIRDTMFYGGNIRELIELKKSSLWQTYKKSIIEDKTGNPDRFIFFPRSSGNLIHQAYSFNEFVKHSEIKISEQNNIFEFGGGYGSFCRFIYRMNYNGNYIIYDLPIFSLLQKYFLKSLHIIENISYNSTLNNTTNKSVDLYSDYEKLIQNKSLKNIDVFVGLWSISECPIDLRNKIFSLIDNPKYFLIGFQKNVPGVDNYKYFVEFMNQHTNYNWELNEISFIKNNFYLIGSLK